MILMQSNRCPLMNKTLSSKKHQSYGIISTNDTFLQTAQKILAPKRRLPNGGA